MIYLKYLQIKSIPFDIKDEDNSLYYDIEDFLEKHNKNYFKIYIGRQKNYKRKDNSYQYVFTAMMYVNTFLNKNKKKTFNDLIEEIKSVIAEIKKIYLTDMDFAELELWTVKSLTLSNEIKLNHNYCEYIDIIKDLNPKYSNLIVDYCNGNAIYFLNESKKTKDISDRTKYVKFENLIREIKLKASNDKKEHFQNRPENILLIEMPLKKDKLDLSKNTELNNVFEKYRADSDYLLNSSYTPEFDYTPDTTKNSKIPMNKTIKLTLEDIKSDATNGFKKIKKYFLNDLKSRFFVNKPEEVLSLDKETLFNYLNKQNDPKISQGKLYLFIIGCLLVDIKGQNLKPIKQYLLDKMSKPADVQEKFNIIKKIRDYVVKDNRISSIELYNEIYEKIFDAEEPPTKEIINEESFDEESDIIDYIEDENLEKE